MRAKSMILIFIALVCGLVASIGISQVMDSSSGDGDGPKIETEEVYVAVADIDIDEQLNAENVKLEGWPAGKVPENAARKFEDIEGMYPNMRFVEGEPILLTKLRNSHQSPVIHIEKGYRVVPIEVRRDTICNGLINPGDRVDIIGFFRRNGDIPQTMTRKILKNVRLFAVNDQTERSSVDDDGKAVNVQTVSLLIKDEQVNRLLLAVELGTLRMSLRRPDEEDQDEITEDASIDSLFIEGTEDADEDDGEAVTNVDDAPSILDMLGSVASTLESPLVESPMIESPLLETQPVAPAPPAHTMLISGPDGTLRKFVWHDESGPAEEVFDDGFAAMDGVAPAPVATESRAEDSTEENAPHDEGSEEQATEEEIEEAPVGI